MLAFKDHLTLMARYNEVMNAKLVALVTPVPAEELLAPRGAFFGSVLGTMNHILVADLLWLRRMRHLPAADVLSRIDVLPDISHLTDLLYPDMAAYAAVRAELDNLIRVFVDRLTDDDLSAALSYVNTAGDPFVKTLGLVLDHVFNHQTHHRGQVTTLLSQMGLDIGVTDLNAIIPSL